jgi:2-methylcitrate dehydratase PrpD
VTGPTRPIAAEELATWLATVDGASLPQAVGDIVRRLAIDVTGLCLAARREDYVAAMLAAVDRGGACTAIGHAGAFDAFGAALVNGTAAHGEDYDDTFEGGPVHAGAVVVPAVLAVCEREQLPGERLRAGIAAGVEVMCRLSLVAPTGAHRAGFHPTAVFGALAAAAGVGVALRTSSRQLASALGIAGSMASGIIEYLAEGTWTKRMHAGWAAQSGIRAALMARGGFEGPRTVLDGTHGFFKAFAHSIPADFSRLLDGLGTRWVTPDLAFKPYACGTMTQPFIDCAIALARESVNADDIVAIECRVGEGTVHRLWEPLASKQRPPTPYAAKFSTPFCMAVAFFDRRAGFAQFTEQRTRDRSVLALASKISYVVDPADEYPRNFSGHLRATLRDGRIREHRQPHMRGGAREPLTDRELHQKFVDNACHGGYDRAAAEALLTETAAIIDGAATPSVSGFRA